MKTLLATLVLLGSMTASASQVCTNTDGSLGYENVTTYGDSIVITNPYFEINGTRAYLYSWSSDGLCVSLGYSKVLQTQFIYQSRSIPIVTLDESGNLSAFGEYSGKHTLKHVTCRK